jgi:hypothetical protein
MLPYRYNVVFMTHETLTWSYGHEAGFRVSRLRGVRGFTSQLRNSLIIADMMKVRSLVAWRLPGGRPITPSRLTESTFLCSIEGALAVWSCLVE